jgi:hypothetical protein
MSRADKQLTRSYALADLESSPPPFLKKRGRSLNSGATTAGDILNAENSQPATQSTDQPPAKKVNTIHDDIDALCH